MKIFARNPVCMLCLESKDSRHVVKIFSKAGGNLEGCPSFRHSLPPSLIKISVHANLSHPQFLGVFWVM